MIILYDFHPSICAQLKVPQQQILRGVMSSAFHSSLCLFKTCMLMICHIQEMCDWLTRACGRSCVVLMYPDERESSSGYSRKIHGSEEWKQRNATVIDFWQKIYTSVHTYEALPAKQIQQNCCLVYSILTSWQRAYLKIGWNEDNVLFQSLKQPDMFHSVVRSGEESGFHWALNSFDK